MYVCPERRLGEGFDCRGSPPHHRRKPIWQVPLHEVSLVHGPPGEISGCCVELRRNLLASYYFVLDT